MVDDAVTLPQLGQLALEKAGIFLSLITFFELGVLKHLVLWVRRVVNALRVEELILLTIHRI